jgi:hypothetical protein
VHVGVGVASELLAQLGRDARIRKRGGERMAQRVKRAAILLAVPPPLHGLKIEPRLQDDGDSVEF